jgi:hypothetical protein
VKQKEMGPDLSELHDRAAEIDEPLLILKLDEEDEF